MTTSDTAWAPVNGLLGSLHSKRIGNWAVLAILAVYALANPRLTSAQAVYGSVFGTVTDSTGAVVPNATVTVTDVAKGTSETALSNESGQYRVQHLIPDTYTVAAEAKGFNKVTTQNVIVYADTAPKVDITLAVGSVSNTVNVTSSAPLLQADHVDVNVVLNERAVETLPNFNRNFTAFELLTPGTSYIGWNVGEAQNPQRSQQIEVDGQLPFATGYELDGTDNQDPVIGIAVINPNLDAISEEKVTSQNYDAEFGKAVAGLVTAQTRSGSNSLHGSAFEYWRSDALQARDPFTEYQPDPLTHRFIPGTLHNQFGGSLGGPIIKDKVFFFGDYQGLRERTGSATLTTVPTALAKSSCTSGGDCNLSDYLVAPPAGAGIQIFDPATNETSLTDRTAFAGNIIPAGRLSAAAVNFFKLLPAPNVAGAGIVNNYLASGSGPFNTNQLDARLDDKMTEKLHLFGRYTYFSSDLSGDPYFGAAGGQGFGNGGFAGTDNARDQSVAAGGDYVVSPRWLTDFRFGYYRIHLNEEGPNFTQPLGNQLGIPNANVGNLSLNGGLPQFNIDNPSNGTNGSANLEYGTSANQFQQNASQFQLVNNWSHLVGNHNIKFGGDVRYGLNHIIGLDNNNVRSGNYHFAAIRTGSDTSPGLGFATFLLGDTTAFQRTQTQNTNAQERQKRIFSYIQDQWRVTNKLTLNYGLRWEIYFPETVNGKGQGGLLDLNTGDIRIAGYGPYGTNLNVQKSFTNLAPRIGFAYQFMPNTVVRAGYGRVYGQGWSGNTYGEVLTFSFPTQVSQNLNPVTNAAAVFNLTQPLPLPLGTVPPGPPGFTFAPIPASGNFPLPDGVSVPTRPLFVRLPTLDAWNLAVQQQITPTMALQVSYVGSHGIHNMFDSSNQASPNTQTIAGFNDCNPTHIVFAYGCTPQDINPLTALPYTQSDRRPYFNGIAQKLGVGFGQPFGWEQDLRFNANEATSNYNALQVRVDKRFSGGLQFLSHFTWSKAETHESYYFFIDPRVGYGPSYYNRPEVFVFAGNYDLPFGKGRMFGGNASGWVNRLIGGFSINGSFTWEDGLPWTPSYDNSGQDNDVIGFLNRSGSGGFSTHVGPFNPATHKVQFFTPSPYVLQPPGQANSTFGAFARPLVGTFGNIGRDSFLGPGYINTDLSVSKSVSLREQLNLQFRADFFNLFNKVNLGQPDSCVDCQDGNAGTISSIVASQDGSSMRRIQLSARIQF
ncbi:MAG TPA: TonB-dependent receptor [Candidatus Polarisedimenticolia bacterium]|nr:TonB-dependent receptor [Candidatus Polarisedimenticolia bacterium]